MKFGSGSDDPRRKSPEKLPPLEVWSSDLVVKKISPKTESSSSNMKSCVHAKWSRKSHATESFIEASVWTKKYNTVIHLWRQPTERPVARWQDVCGEDILLIDIEWLILHLIYAKSRERAAGPTCLWWSMLRRLSRLSAHRLSWQ